MTTRKDATLRESRQNKIVSMRLKRKTKSLLFIISLCLNAFLLHKIFLSNESKNIIVKSNQDSQKELVDKVYNLANYKSVSKYNSTLESRYQRLLKAYVIDSSTPKEKRYTSNGQVKEEWEKRCRDVLRRIINLEARVHDLEISLGLMFTGVDDSYINDIIKQKGYEEKLSEMSNFYASFLDEYYYNLIVHTTD